MHDLIANELRNRLAEPVKDGSTAVFLSLYISFSFNQVLLFSQPYLSFNYICSENGERNEVKCRCLLLIYECSGCTLKSLIETHLFSLIKLFSIKIKKCFCSDASYVEDYRKLDGIGQCSDASSNPALRRVVGKFDSDKCYGSTREWLRPGLLPKLTNTDLG